MSVVMDRSFLGVASFLVAMVALQLTDEKVNIKRQHVQRNNNNWLKEQFTRKTQQIQQTVFISLSCQYGREEGVDYALSIACA